MKNCFFGCSLIILFFGLGTSWILRSCQKPESLITSKVLLSAYSDGVISGADISFYANGSFLYESHSIGQTKAYFGTYSVDSNHISLAYTTELPSIKATEIRVDDGYLVFLQGGNDNEIYSFNIDLNFRGSSFIRIQEPES